MPADDNSLPPLTLARRALAIRDEAYHGFMEAQRTTIRHPAEARALADSVKQAKSRKLAAPASANVKTPAGVQVIPICGTITPFGSIFSLLFGSGMGGLMGFRESFAEAMGSPDVGAIVLEVDSPGGYVDLVPETAAMIRAAKGNGKKIVSVVNTQACSAAYWLASQADEVVCTPSGEAGSVGVYMMHVSYAGMNEQMGIEPTFVKVPPGKTDGNPEEPLSESGKAQWQQDVEDIYAMFVGDVAKGRGVSAEAVMANYGKGHTLLAARAEEAGIVDRIATLDEVVAELFGTPAQEGEAMSALAMRVSARLAEGTERLLAVGGDDDEDDEDELDEDEDGESVPPGDDEDDEDDDEDEQKPVVDDVEGEPQAANPAQGKCSLCGKYVESGTVCGGCKGSQTAEAAETAAFLASL